MSLTNLGNQKITFKTYERAKADDINSLFSDILPIGIYKIGDILFSNNEITLPPFIVLLKYDTNKNLIVKTTGTIILDSIIPSTPYITCNYIYNDTIQNYLNFEFKDYGSLEDTDIVFGKAEFSGANVVGIDVLEATYGTTVKRDNEYNLEITHTSNSGLIMTENISENCTFDYLDIYEKEYLNVVDDKSLITKKTTDNLLPLYKNQYNITTGTEFIITDDYLKNNYYITNNGIGNDLLVDFSNISNNNSLVGTIVNYADNNIIVKFSNDSSVKFYNSKLSNNMEYLNIPKKGISCILFGVNHSSSQWFSSYIYIPYLFKINGSVPDTAIMEIYRETENVWYANLNFPELIWKSVGLSLSSLKGYIINGESKSSGSRVNYNYQYSDSTTVWTSKTNRSLSDSSISGFSSSLYAYVTSGTSGYRNFDQYYETTEAWTSKTDFSSSIFLHKMTYYYNQGYLFGGYVSSYPAGVSDNAYNYNISSDAWSSLTSMAYTLAGHSVSNTYFDIFILTGTFSYPTISSSSFQTKYNIINETYVSKAAIPLRVYSTSFSYQSHAYCSGGSINGTTADYQDLYFYNLTGDSWSTKSDTNSKQYYSNGFSI